MYGEETYFIGLKNLNDDFKKLIISFFKYHYFERITLDQLKQSSWLQSVGNDDHQAEL